MVCPDTSIVARLAHEWQARPIYCRRWTCTTCRDIRRRELIRLAIRGKPTRFLTITASVRHFKTPEEAALALRDAWRAYVKAWKKAHPGQKIDYLVVFERTKNGYPHLHILLRSPYLPQQHISRYMQRRINSPVVWIERVLNDDQVARYVSKYIGKDPQKFPGTKRYYATTGWDRLTKKDKFLVELARKPWMFVPVPLDAIAFELDRDGIAYHTVRDTTYIPTAGDEEFDRRIFLAISRAYPIGPPPD